MHYVLGIAFWLLMFGYFFIDIVLNSKYYYFVRYVSYILIFKTNLFTKTLKVN